jgi:hypothetical protein
MAEAVVSVSKQEIIAAVKQITSTYRTKMTLRQIYYRLVSKNLIPNNINAYKSLSDTLARARERGQLPSHIMEDRGRETIGGDYIDDTPEEFIQRRLSSLDGCWNQFTKSMWDRQPEYIEVWVEKDALSRLVSQACGGYKVKTCVGRGYSSYTYVADAVDRFLSRKDKQCTVIYLGDFDPSGLDIARDVGARLAEYGADHVSIKRIGLTKAQINQYSLPPAPVKTSDARSKEFITKHGKEVWELDALEPNVLQSTIQAEITDHIDADLWEAVREETLAGREEIKESITEWLGVLKAGGVEAEE